MLLGPWCSLPAPGALTIPSCPPAFRVILRTPPLPLLLRIVDRALSHCVQQLQRPSDTIDDHCRLSSRRSHGCHADHRREPGSVDDHAGEATTHAHAAASFTSTHRLSARRRSCRQSMREVTTANRTSQATNIGPIHQIQLQHRQSTADTPRASLDPFLLLLCALATPLVLAPSFML